jgi:site-specific DNA-methyltransferase (adenine-specific)
MQINLMNGDCLELMKLIPDGSVDFILTDPPYGTTACKWDSVIPFEPMWEQIWRVLKPNGVVALFGSEPFSSNLRVSQLKYFKYDWIWEKNHYANFASIKKQPGKVHEIISVFSRKSDRYFPVMLTGFAPTRSVSRKTSTKTYEDSTNDTIQRNEYTRNGSTDRYPTSILKIPKENKLKAVHPTQKPVTLLEYLIKTYTLEGETVLDFTAGSGSTGVAAKNTNRNFIGIEKDEKYFEIAKERIENAIGDIKLQTT